MSNCCPSLTLLTIHANRLTIAPTSLCASPLAPTNLSKAIANIASPALIAVGKPYSMWTAFRPRRVSSSSIMSSWTKVKLCTISIAAPTSSRPECESPTALPTNQGRVALSLLPPPSIKCIMAFDSRECLEAHRLSEILRSTSGLTSIIEVFSPAPVAVDSISETSPMS